MDIRKLYIFRETARLQSFTGAARTLHMTQPAISKAIAELEKEANTLLFERYPKQAALTPAGKLLLTRCEALLDLYWDVEQSLTRLDSHATLQLGSSITVANEQLPDILKRLNGQFPLVKVQVEVASTASIMEKLSHNELDAAFVEGVIAQPWAASIRFSSYTIHPVCSPAFAAAYGLGDSCQTCINPNGLDSPDIQAFASLPLLLREPGSAIRNAVDSLFLLHDQSVVPSWTSTNSAALLHAALEGFGIAFLPGNMVRKKLEEGALTELIIPGFPLENHNHFVYKMQKHLNEPLAFLVQMLQRPHPLS